MMRIFNLLKIISTGKKISLPQNDFDDTDNI